MSFRFNQGDRPLPGYTIQRGVGRGGFGEVYYAVSDGGKEVALKYLRENPQVELRGATHCLNLKSPYLVDLHDIKQNAQGEFFVIMEFVHGVSMRDLMNEEPKGLGPQKAAYFVREIAKGLAYLHDRGIVHRDLKPGNIFYEDGYVKIGDYGLSKMMAASQHSGQTVSVGTVHYMAPEVGSGNYDRTIDIYALGVILYEMLLGRVPFSGSSMGEVLMKHLTAQPEVDELPAPFGQVIRKALAKDPRDRYQTVNELVAELFEVDDLSRSVATFEPASISTLAARAVRKAGVLAGDDVMVGGVMIGGGSSNVGRIGAPPVISPRAESPGGGRIAGSDGRFGGGDHRAAHDEYGAAVNGAAVALTARPAEPIGKALLACVGAGAAVAIIREKPFEFGVAVSLHCLAVVVGAFLWHRLSLRNERPSKHWTGGLFFAAIAGGLVFVLNGLLIGAGWIESSAVKWTLPCIASFVLCDWWQRFQDGRLGIVSLGSAAWIAAFGFIATKIAGGRDTISVMGILAGASFGVQALAGMWPMTKPVGKKAKRARSKSPDGDGSFDATLSAGAAGVVVSRDGAGPALRGPQGSAPTASNSDDCVSPPLRSNSVRVLWSVATFVSLIAMLLCFIAIGTMNLRGGDYNDTLIAGIVLSQVMLLCLSCAVPKYHKGLWRGVYRKVIFFGSTAVVAGAGASIGLYNAQGDELFIAVSVILIAGLAALFVWFIPVPLPEFAKHRDLSASDEQSRRRMAKSRTYKLVGLGCWGVGLLCIPLILMTVRERDWDEAFPGTLIPLGFIGLGLIIRGAYLGRQPKKKPEEPARLELPMRRTCSVMSVTHLRRLLERYAFLNGYRLDSEIDMMWRFVRGDWTAQFWQSDIRKWKTELTIAAYEDGLGQYRVTCQLDVESGFNKPDRSMLQRLHREIDDLQALLEGGDAPSGKEVVIQR